MEMQKRSIDFVLNTQNEKKFDSDYYIEGMATTFNQPYELYKIGNESYFEVIDRNALNFANMSDVILLYDHDSRVLARTSNNTLELKAKDDGLYIYADLSKSEYARSLYEDVKNGLITKMSWSFRVNKWDIDKDNKTDIVKEIDKVFDVSLVSLPANENTSVQARKKQNENELLIKKRKIQLELDVALSLNKE